MTFFLFYQAKYAIRCVSEVSGARAETGRRQTHNLSWPDFLLLSKAASERCSMKKPFLKIMQYLQENTCVGVSFLLNVANQNIVKFFRNIYFENVCELLLLRYVEKTSVYVDWRVTRNFSGQGRFLKIKIKY